jgi:type IV pilus assembly protein PilB
VDHEAVALLPERVAKRRSIIPIGYDDEGAIIVAMSDPLDIESLDEVELRSGKRAVAVVATDSEIDAAIDKYMTGQDAFQEVVDLSVEAADEQRETDAEILAGNDVPVVRLVNQIIKEAVIDRASDIHFEPFEKDIRVRYRVDGVLHDVMHLPKSIRPELTSRLKIMADMNITERRRPQDGRIQLQADHEAVDLRVATLPTPYGESIVIRVLSSGLQYRSLEDLGMNTEHLAQMETLLRRPFGAILIAGPTGSGKSTTLYASLTRINDASRKIITVEDPVEYRMDGITQIGVNNSIGLSFAAGLRQILRSDPDVVMIGEVRDPETAEIAVRAALTGHLVLSSIHTNDAPSGLPRLTDMGVAPYITSAALLAICAQRLVRKLCPKCKAPVPASETALLSLGVKRQDIASMITYGPVGCDYCDHTGYRGRIGIFELMVLDDEMRRQFLKGVGTDQLRWIAVQNGMRTLREDAFEKVASGMTSLDEMVRVVI